MTAEPSKRTALVFGCCAGLLAAGLAAWSWTRDTADSTRTETVDEQPARVSDTAPAPAADNAERAPNAPPSAEPQPSASAPADSVAQGEGTTAAATPSEPATPAPGAATQREPTAPNARGPALEALRSHVRMPRPHAGLVDARISNGRTRTPASAELCSTLAERRQQGALPEQEQALWRRFCTSR